MAPREPYAADHHWGSEVVDIRAHDLPALKAGYLIGALGTTGRVLEIGCGSGRILNTIAAHRPGLELHGCDIRPLTTTPSTFEFRQVDPRGATLPYKDGQFDYVVAYDVLEHLADPGATLAEAHRISAGRGRLVSFTPLEGGARSAYRFYRRLLGDDLYVDTKEHLQAFDLEGLTALVDRHFQIVDQRYAYHLIGHLMDATLFALMRAPAIRNRFWSENPYYREGEVSPGAPSVFERVLKIANAVAYAESRALGHVRATAAGVLLTASSR